MELSHGVSHRLEWSKALGPGGLSRAEECTVLNDGFRGMELGVASGLQREGGEESAREKERLRAKLGKPTAKSAVTLLVKLADGHFASFAFC